MSASGRPESFTAEVIWSVEFAEQAESRANAIIDIASLMTSPNLITSILYFYRSKTSDKSRTLS